MTEPRISVITVCFNAAATIEHTIDSVLAQSWPHVEYIVIDGASTDATMDIVRSRAVAIDRVVSEPDGGIFDAMNKGAALATGDVLYFLNADDVFVDAGVLADVAAAFSARPDAMLVYGHVLLRNGPQGVVNYPARPFVKHSISEFLHNSFCHQAVFARRQLFDALGPFDARLRYTADYEWIIRAYKRHGGRDFLFIDRNIAHYYFLGRSQQNARVTGREVLRMQARHFASLEYAWYFLRYVLARRAKKWVLRESH